MNSSKNREILTRVVAERSIIRNISKHRKPDGSMDIEGNLKLWDSVMEQFALERAMCRVAGKSGILTENKYKRYGALDKWGW